MDIRTAGSGLIIKFQFLMTNDLTDRNTLIDYLKSHGLWAKHGLGQNFLVDRDVLDKIVEAAELNSGDTVIEVGSGLGTLTGELVKTAGKVVAVELDEKLATLLESNYKLRIMNDGKLEVLNEDILKINIPELIGEKPYKVVANIPYYITSKIIELFLTQENKPELIVMLVQKEVAARICAKPGQLSILALSVQAYGQPEIIDIVPKESFFPSPNVDSAILKISNIKSRISKQFQNSKSENSKFVSDFDIDASDLPTEQDFFRLVHVGFSSKRKTLANNLTAGYHLDKKRASDIIKSAGLSENVRAQELSIEEWLMLLRTINS